MKKIFIDANAWIALNNKRDQFHNKALRLNKKLLKERCYYITTNFVLDETYTGLLMKVGHFAALDFGERIRNSKITTIIHVAEEIEYESRNLFKQYSDKFFSLFAKDVLWGKLFRPCSLAICNYFHSLSLYLY